MCPPDDGEHHFLALVRTPCPVLGCCPAVTSLKMPAGCGKEEALFSNPPGGLCSLRQDGPLSFWWPLFQHGDLLAMQFLVTLTRPMLLSHPRPPSTSTCSGAAQLAGPLCVQVALAVCPPCMLPWWTASAEFCAMAPDLAADCAPAIDSALCSHESSLRGWAWHCILCPDVTHDLHPSIGNIT